MTKLLCGRARWAVLVCTLVLGCLPLQRATADIVLSDDFSNALVRTTADNYGVGTVSSAGDWVGVNAAVGGAPNGTLSVNSGKMFFAPFDNGSVAGSLQGVAAKFTPQTLSNVGDSITLKFDFGFLAQPNTIATGGGAAGGFRFGLYNDAGTSLLSNDGNQDVDDVGYRVGISVVGSPTGVGSRIARESGTDSNAAVGSGSDNAYFAPDPGPAIPAVGTATHTAQLSITKTLTSANVRFTYDGVLQWMRTDAASPAYLNFNEIGIVQNGIYSGTPLVPPNATFFLDNLTVDFSLPTVRGDANGDAQVNFSDLSLLLLNYNQPGTYTQGDFDASGTVNFSDLSLLLLNYNQPVATAATLAAPVPEPSSLVLLGLGTVALLQRGGRKLWSRRQ